jgi:hypothetical protein
VAVFFVEREDGDNGDDDEVGYEEVVVEATATVISASLSEAPVSMLSERDREDLVLLCLPLSPLLSRHS